MAEQSRTGWHLKKEIELSQIITILVVAVGVVLYISRIEQRVAIIEAQMEIQKETNAIVRQQFDRINEKLDRIIAMGNK